MKKPLLFLSIVLTTFSLCAQPTLTPSNSNPIIGEVVTSYDAPYVSPGNAGANQTWDFSSLSGASAGTYSVVSTASTPSGVNFPNSNMCIHADTNYAYFNANSSSFQYVGLSSDTINMSYSNPQDWLRYPMTFNSSYSDDFAVTFNSMSVQFFRKGIAKVTADAYGTLITPVGTFNNTLRVHTILSYKDSANYMGFPIEIIYGE
ncbi:MAG TPA: hypothetical protein VFL70_07245, partial [Bacteroidia bacterium]|nr:hypothetical protein [Bacteroidia bacterium]